jgi:pyrimidine nucleoside transport protein
LQTFINFGFEVVIVLILCYDCLQFILGKVFIPLAWIMGVKWDECEEVARLVGIKTIVNEFVAYEQFGESKRAGLLSVSNSLLFYVCGKQDPDF